MLSARPKDSMNYNFPRQKKKKILLVVFLRCASHIRFGADDESAVVYKFRLVRRGHTMQRGGKKTYTFGQTVSLFLWLVVSVCVCVYPIVVVLKVCLGWH